MKIIPTSFLALPDVDSISSGSSATPLPWFSSDNPVFALLERTEPPVSPDAAVGPFPWLTAKVV